MSKGQQAMALAMIYPETHPGKKTKGSATLLQSNKLSSARISQARTVLRLAKQSPEHAWLVGPRNARRSKVQQLVLGEYCLNLSNSFSADLAL
jgi:hypothetical protein